MREKNSRLTFVIEGRRLKGAGLLIDRWSWMDSPIGDLQGLIENLEAFLELFFCHDQRGNDQDSVPVRIDVQAMVEAILAESSHFGRG